MADTTPNYALDLYTDGDPANLRDQYNASMNTIDGLLKTVNNATANNKNILDALGATDTNTATASKTRWDETTAQAATNKTNIAAIDANLNALHANTIVDATNLYNIIQKTTNIKIATPEMYGAKGDTTTDDTTAIQNALNDNDTVIFTQKYLINNTIQISEDKNLYFIGGIIYANNTAFNTNATIKEHYHYVNIYNAKIINNNPNINNNPAITTNGLKLRITNSEIQDFKGGGIITHNKIIDNVKIQGNLTAENLILLILNGYSNGFAINTKDTTDSRGNLIYIKDYRIAIGDNDGEWSNIHTYVTHNEIYETSMVVSHSGGAIRITNIYADTIKFFYTADRSDDPNYFVEASNITFYTNTVVTPLNTVYLINNNSTNIHVNITNVISRNASRLNVGNTNTWNPQATVIGVSGNNINNMPPNKLTA